jgi:hypothetical protein
MVGDGNPARVCEQGGQGYLCKNGRRWPFRGDGRWRKPHPRLVFASEEGGVGYLSDNGHRWPLGVMAADGNPTLGSRLREEGGVGYLSDNRCCWPLGVMVPVGDGTWNPPSARICERGGWVGYLGSGEWKIVVKIYIQKKHVPVAQTTHMASFGPVVVLAVHPNPLRWCKQ